MPESDQDRLRPDVSAVLEALHERVEAWKAEEGADSLLRVYRTDDYGIVRRISDEVAALTGVGRIRPNVETMMDVLREHIDQIDVEVNVTAVGTVQHIGRGVARLSGLPNSRTDELVEFPTGVLGLILNLEHDYVDVILLGPEEGIQGGDLVTATGRRLRVPAGVQLLGRVMNPLGQPLDDESPTDASHYWLLEHDAPGIVERTPVDQPLMTGWKVIDALIPIGRGQRELIVGDRQTGKTTLAVDAIINQRDSGVACVYVAIGQKKSTTLAVIETLREAQALDYTTVVVSSPDDPPALRYLSPYAGCTMAEGVMRDGRDVLIVYDDLSKHADAYRELSLLLRRPPGREAYPGDIFYLHSRLLERACRLNEEAGGGSLTALPIVETQQGNLSAYIPTNLISITDGQIVLDSDMFNRGIKPAIDAGRSVSRVGGSAQPPAMRKVASNLRLELAQFEEVERFARFGTEVDEATQQQIRRGQRLQTLLKQPAHRPLALGAQVVVLAAADRGAMDDIPLDQIRAFQRALIARFQRDHPAIFSQLNRTGELADEFDEALKVCAEAVRAEWLEER